MASISRRFAKAAPRHASIEAERAYARTLERLAGITAQPTTLGRYEVLERIGEGGAAVVYTCRDPELDRVAAVKVLRSRGRAHADLAKEAAMLARLTHPNVVQVFDVGVDGDRVFVAMEYVAGQSLDRWLADRPRAWPELHEVFTQAAAGLAAAHGAGLVHCDIKPSNILVGDDGRARIADFGLALIAASDQRSGIAGTPAYMAPEQAAGERPDARSDQFGYFASLYDAVYGSPPRTDNATSSAVGDATRSNTPDTIAPQRPTRAGLAGLPRALPSVIRRGLDPDPARRFASMLDAMRALPTGHARTRWALGIVAAAGVVAAAAVLLGGQHVGTAARACTQESAVWSSAQRDAAVDGLIAHDVAQRVVPLLDGYAKDWSEARAIACADEGAPVGAVSCLDRTRSAFTDLVEDLADADASMSTLASIVVPRVGRPSQCLERGSSAPMDPPPFGAASAVAAARRELRASEALVYVDGVEKARARVDALADREIVARYAPLHAEVENLRGTLAEHGARFADARDHWEAAHALGTVARHDRVVVAAALGMAFSVLQRQSDAPRAEQWRRHAEAALERLNWPDDLAAIYERYRNLVAVTQGDHRAALAHATAAARHAEAAFGPDNSKWLLNRINMANSLARLGRFPEADGVLAELEPKIVARFGRRHLITMNLRMSQGTAANAKGDAVAAARVYREAEQISTKIRGPEAIGTLMMRQNYASALVEAGFAVEAVPLLRESLAPMQQQLPAEHSLVLYARLMLATAQRKADQFEGMQPLAPLAAGFESLGDLAGMASVRCEWAGLQRQRGDLPRALAFASQCVSMWVEAAGPDDADVASALRELGAIQRAMGDRQAARETYTRAHRIDSAFAGPECLAARADRQALASLDDDGATNALH